MKKLLLAGLLLSPFYGLFGQQLDYARTINQIGTEYFVKSVYDHSDQLVVYGARAIVGGPGGGAGPSNAWLQKYDTNGSLIWTLGTNYTQNGSEIQPMDISIDSEDNVYILASLSAQSITLGGVTYTPPSHGGSNMIYAKISSIGVVQWIKGFGQAHFSSNTCIGSSIFVTPDDQLLLTGGYYRGLIIGNDTLAGIGNANVSNMPVPFGFYAKLDSNGTPIWAKRFSNLVTGEYNSFSGISSSAVDDDGNLFFLMGLDSAVVMGNDTISSSNWMAVIKTDPSGNFIRAVIPQAGPTHADEIALDYCGNLLLLGRFFDSIQVENTTLNTLGNWDIFVTKFDHDLDLLWMKQFYSTGGDRAGGIACNNRNDIFFNFDFWGEINYDGPYSPTPLGNTDGILFKLDEDGNTVWHKKTTGSGSITVESISVSPSGKVGMAARYQGQENFDGTIINTTPTNLPDICSVSYTDTTLAALPANCEGNLGLTDLINQESMLIYPNPTRETITIAVHGNAQKAFVSITDLSGRVMHTARVLEKTPVISVANFPEGIYILRMQLENGETWNGKFIVKH
ncbi:hypothetical protein D3C87_39040 [compost metagenome]